MKLIGVMPDKCAGCRLCELVCSLYHDGECSTAKSRIRVFRDEEFGNNLISVCLQCADPSCVDGCAYGVISRAGATGVVEIDDNLCTGCGECIPSCPIGALSLHKDRKIAFKCDLCGGNPECVPICPREALTFGDVAPDAAERIAFRQETSQRLQQIRSTGEVAS